MDNVKSSSPQPMGIGLKKNSTAALLDSYPKVLNQSQDYLPPISGMRVKHKEPINEYDYNRHHGHHIA